jgi:hypothetical protein
MKQLVTSAAVSAVLCAALPARGTIVTVNPSKDNTLFESGDTLSNGAGPHIYVGETSFAGARRALLAFDIAAAVPAGSTINSASLALTVTMIHGFNQTITLHRLSSDWGEAMSNAGEPGGGGTAAQTGDATWKYSFFSSSEWATEGGDFVATPSSSAIVDSFTAIAFSSSAQLVADVQSWLDTPAGNFGWLIKGDESFAGTANRFGSRENFDSEAMPPFDNRPRLTIDYTEPPPPPATSYAGDSDRNWDDPLAWTGGVPNAVNTIVTLGSVITQPRTITLDAARTAGVVNFDSAQRYTISGSGSITLDGFACAINVVSGSHTVGVPLSLSRNTSINVGSADSVLMLGAPMSLAAEIILTKSGPGTLELKHLRGDDVRINGGVVKVLSDGGDAATSNITSLTIATGAALDLTDNDLVLGEQDSITADNVRQMLLEGKLTTSLATGTRGLGYADNSVTALAVFSGQTVDAGNTLVKYTYLGDADLNGQVDVNDLGKLASAWQSAGLWTDGDFDYSGTVNVNDLGLLASSWQAGVGDPLAPSLDDALRAFGLASVAVPEPASVSLLVAAAVGLCRRRRFS